MKYTACFLFAFLFTLFCKAQGTVFTRHGNDMTLQNDSGIHISNYRKSVDYGSVKSKHLYIKYDTNSNYWMKAEWIENPQSQHAVTLLNFRGEMLYRTDYIKADLVADGKQWCLFQLGDTNNLLAGITGDIHVEITGRTIDTRQQAILQLEGKPNSTNIITTVPQGITKGRIFHSKKKLKSKAVFNEFSVTTSKGEVMYFPSGSYFLFAAKTVTIQ